MPGSTADPEQQMRAYIEAWNDQDPDAIVEFLSEDCDQFSRAELRRVAKAWFSAFPDLTHEIEELAADGSRVLARLTLRGTHRGTFKGVPATGTEIEVADHVSVRFADGQIVELHATADFTRLFEQVGAAGPSEDGRRENKALLERYFQAVNERDRATYTDTLAADFSYGDIEGPAEMADNEWRWLEAMDLTWHVEGMHAGEDFVATRSTVTGTHRGEILGLEPTGEDFEISALTLSLVEDGEIVEWFGEWNFASLLDQIGAIDSPVYDG